MARGVTVVPVRIVALDVETQKPIPFSRVEIYDARTGRLMMVTATDERGIAEVSLPPGKYVVVFKSLIYKPIKQEVEITGPVELTIKTHKIIL